MNQKENFTQQPQQFLHNQFIIDQEIRAQRDATIIDRSESQPKLYDLINALQYQDKEMEELINGFYALIERVDRVANSIDSSNYSKNHPSTEDLSKHLVGEGAKVQSTGIVLELEKAIDRRRLIINTIHGKIIPLMSEGINYLERHI